MVQAQQLNEGDPGQFSTRATWRIPVGSTAHAEAVSLGTILTAVLACISVIAVLFRDRLAQMDPGPASRAKAD